MTTRKLSRLNPFFKKLPVDVVYLYGSRAKGLSDSLSDYDFGVIWTINTHADRRFNLILDSFAAISKILGLPEDDIDVVDLESASLLLQFNAISGRVIYCRNQERRVLFETQVLARYHDEHYYLDRYFWETLTKIDKGGYFERPVSHH